MQDPTVHASEAHRCPACGSSDPDVFYRLEGVPAADALILDSREEAIAFPRGDVELAWCRCCGFVFNASFVARLTEYSARYEERQSASPTFTSFQRALVERLIERYDLRRKTIVEIGCGKGEFLSALCELGDNRGIGFDPAWRAGVAAPARGHVEIQKRLFDEDTPYAACDFVICRMTLEHIAEVGRFVRQLARWLDAGVTVLFQVPDAARILAEGAFWDVYYEHCSYFTESSLTALFTHAGFEVLRATREYGAQYLTMEAMRRGRPDAIPNLGETDTVARLVENFRAAAPAVQREWRRRIDDWRDANRRVAIWGSGSKAVSFLSTLGIGSEIGCVVDINAARHGRYVPGSGHLISSPEQLREYQPDHIVLMNPVYHGEVAQMLEKTGIATDLVVL